MRLVIVLCMLLGVSFGAQAQRGAFGGTKGFVLELDGATAAPLKRSVGVGSVSVGRRANEIDSVGTFHIGDFDDNERRIIEDSLRETLAGVSWPSAGAPLQTHVVIRHYYVAHSNNDGGIVAGVAWAVTRPDGEPVLTDEFYVAAQKSDMDKRKNLGHLKELVNTAIVRRVAETSLRLAAADDPGSVQPADVHLTHDTVQEAAVGMPENLTSVGGIPSFSRKSHVDWTAGAPTDPFDWKAFMADRHDGTQ